MARRGSPQLLRFLPLLALLFLIILKDKVLKKTTHGSRLHEFSPRDYRNASLRGFFLVGCFFSACPELGINPNALFTLEARAFIPLPFSQVRCCPRSDAAAFVSLSQPSAPRVLLPWADTQQSLREPSQPQPRGSALGISSSCWEQCRVLHFFFPDFWRWVLCDRRADSELTCLSFLGTNPLQCNGGKEREKQGQCRGT